jgi:hypothetical protein
MPRGYFKNVKTVSKHMQRGGGGGGSKFNYRRDGMHKNQVRDLNKAAKRENTRFASWDGVVSTTRIQGKKGCGETLRNRSNTIGNSIMRIINGIKSHVTTTNKLECEETFGDAVVRPEAGNTVVFVSEWVEPMSNDSYTSDRPCVAYASVDGTIKRLCDIKRWRSSIPRGYTPHRDRDCSDDSRVVGTFVSVRVAQDPIRTLPSSTLFNVRIWTNVKGNTDYIGTSADADFEFGMDGMVNLSDADHLYADMARKYLCPEVRGNVAMFPNRFNGAARNESYVKAFDALVKATLAPPSVPDQNLPENPHFSQRTNQNVKLFASA